MPNRFIAPLAALAFLAAPPAFAQLAPRADAPLAAQRGGGIQARLQQAHDRLGITPAQQPQWDAVVAALRENARAMRDSPARAAERAGGLDAVRSLQAAADLARTRADALQRMVPPVQALYATLSPEQQRTADQALAQAMHTGHPRRS